MKRSLLVVLALGISGWALGAQQAATTQAAATKEKETYVHKADKEVNDWSAKIKSLEEESKSSGAEVRANLDRHLKAVHENLDKARKKLDEIRASSATVWKSLQAGFERTMTDVQRHYDKAVATTKPAAKALKKT